MRAGRGTETAEIPLPEVSLQAGTALVYSLGFQFYILLHFFLEIAKGHTE